MNNSDYPRYFTHNKSKTPTYVSWRAMKCRCANISDPSYPRYGAIGISVCDRWANSFENFLCDMGERPVNASLDRYPNKNGNYEPSNCRWATPAMQARNKKTNIMLTIDGVIKSLPEWCDIYLLKQDTVRARLDKGMNAKDALTQPLIPREERGRITGLKNKHADAQTEPF